MCPSTDSLTGAQALQVSLWRLPSMRSYSQQSNRILEDPENIDIARWGDEGDSFMVLEVKTYGTIDD